LFDRRINRSTRCFVSLTPRFLSYRVFSADALLKQKIVVTKGIFVVVV